MFKGTSRFQQSRASSGRTLSGYPEGRQLTGRNQLGGQNEFEVGTAYIKRLSPLVHAFMRSGATPSDIVDELLRHRISTPSGNPWTAQRVAELIGTVQLNDKKYAKIRRKK